MRTLRIEYPNGYMEFVCDEFFPFTLQKAKKIFPLINQYCSADVKKELKDYLTQRLNGYEKEYTTAGIMAADYAVGSKNHKRFTREASKANTLYKRMKKNIEMLEEI